MSEKQVIRAMEILARLYADQMGIENPVITVTLKNKERREKECSKTQ